MLMWGIWFWNSGGFFFWFTGLGFVYSKAFCPLPITYGSSPAPALVLHTCVSCMRVALGMFCSSSVCSTTCERCIRRNIWNPWNPVKADVKSVAKQTKSWNPLCYSNIIIIFCRFLKIKRISGFRLFCNGFHLGFHRISWISYVLHVEYHICLR